MPQYLGDLITWNAIGARTTESQTHREMAGPYLARGWGFKNGTDGSLTVAINALKSARQPHHFLGIRSDGRTAVMQTRGNAYEKAHTCSAVAPAAPITIPSAWRCASRNCARRVYQPVSSSTAATATPTKPSLQPLVARDVIEQVVNGNHSIIGLMLESSLEAGNQEIPANRSKLRYGVSVTDGCIDWATTTNRSLRDLAALLKPVVQARKSA